MPRVQNHEPSTINPQPSTLNPQPSTLDPEPLTLKRPALESPRGGAFQEGNFSIMISSGRVFMIDTPA